MCHTIMWAWATISLHKLLIPMDSRVRCRATCLLGCHCANHWLRFTLASTFCVCIQPTNPQPGNPTRQSTIPLPISLAQPYTHPFSSYHLLVMMMMMMVVVVAPWRPTRTFFAYLPFGIIPPNTMSFARSLAHSFACACVWVISISSNPL